MMEPGVSRRVVDRIWNLPSPLPYFLIPVFVLIYLGYIFIGEIVSLFIVLVYLSIHEVKEWKYRSSLSGQSS